MESCTEPGTLTMQSIMRPSASKSHQVHDEYDETFCFPLLFFFDSTGFCAQWCSFDEPGLASDEPANESNEGGGKGDPDQAQRAYVEVLVQPVFFLTQPTVSVMMMQECRYIRKILHAPQPGSTGNRFR